MELIVRLRHHDRIDDVIASIDDHHTIAHLTAAFSEYLNRSRIEIRSGRTGCEWSPAERVVDVDLVSGDEIIIDGGNTQTGRSAPIDHSIQIDVIAGPDSGQSYQLAPGTLTIGRDPHCEITLTDPSVSRRHATVTFTSNGQITITAPDQSNNGIRLNDQPITGTAPIGINNLITLGGTTLAVRFHHHRPATIVQRGSQIDFHRTPYRPPALDTTDRPALGPIPDKNEKRRFQLIAAFAPLMAGVVMVAITGQLQFLALTAISPIVMIASRIDDRRSGARDYRTEEAEFRRRLDDEVAALADLRDAERIERYRSNPDLADLVSRAEQRSLNLWERSRHSPDVMSLRIGVGHDVCRVTTPLADGGASHLRDDALTAIASVRHLRRVPVTINLVAEPVLGIHGPVALVNGIVSSLIVQTATLHSPDDVVIAAAISPARHLDWLKWLPHLRSVTSPLSGGHLATTSDAANALIRRLIDVIAFRSRPHVSNAPVWPRIVVILDADLHLDGTDTAQLLDEADTAGISVIWIARSEGAIVRHAHRILEAAVEEGAVLSGRLWSVNPDVAERYLELDYLSSATGERVARALAPVRDASTPSLATSIPRQAPLLDVLGVGTPSPEWILDRWQCSDGNALIFPLGVTADGPLVIDLIKDGPHTLIGGTSGSGKSELVQSMVAALAANYPPTKLNFLFVDYKGGASSHAFRRLPHTVGYVTNLSAALAERALTSLTAELNRRMALLEGRAKDRAELVEIAPDDAPPSLVIVIDEFATLVTHVPDFIAGIVDIAQRGRSLGIHLVLATQRPTGAVNDNILANTNLRIALRMLDRSESTSILDIPDAATIAVPLRGRAMMRSGAERVVEFQSAYSSAPLITATVDVPIALNRFDAPDDVPGQIATAVVSPDITHRDAVIDAVVAATDLAGHELPRRPWREVLPEVVTLESVMNDLEHAEVLTPVVDDPGRFIVVGLLDDPANQDQRPAVIDLEHDGGLVAFGSGGAGKTTLLRTVAAGLTMATTDDEVAIVGFDFASRGLAAIAGLPTVVDIAFGDDLEAITRHLAVLTAELERRRRLLAGAGADTLTSYRREHDDAPARIVILIDGCGALFSTFFDTARYGSGGSLEEWAERFIRLIVDGRQVGIHTVITADRLSAVPARLSTALGNRLIMRHADESSYIDYGISGGIEMPPGRAWFRPSVTVQVATLSGDLSASAYSDAVADLIATDGRPPTATMGSHCLPEQVVLPPASSSDLVELGVADITGEPVAIDLSCSGLTIVGPPRSGRSNVLAVIANALAPHQRLFVVGPSSSPLAHLNLDGAWGGVDRLADPLSAWVDRVEPTGGILLVDDADLLDDPRMTPLWERIIRCDRITVVVTAELAALTSFGAHPLIVDARRSRRFLVIQPDDPAEFFRMVGLRVTGRPGVELPPGRGFLLADRNPVVVQTYRFTR
ncbi:MAG: hypothetical protein CSA55_05095 [Ilumatobacter coccineus]|uniref:FHA domain-containing protein n=1 Tax=Ilumatobacter coccineus TaxID=467094 RepID=A0A2G6KAB2_9ACTN|nr:MAG: hypothetical protein CSA55_05095 [Ilumatobacter coccineus]